MTLTHQTTGRSEITATRFSVVKRNVLASAYKNGQVVIWDTSQIFIKPKDEVSIAAKKFVFAAHDNKPCTGISFS